MSFSSFDLRFSSFVVSFEHLFVSIKVNSAPRMMIYSYLCGVKTRTSYILAFILGLWLSASTLSAQSITADVDLDRKMVGAPIFSHYMGYAGTVVYDGEEIPWIVLSDVYIFNDLVFKSKREAKKYYKIAANIKKVYPIAVEIQHTVEACLAHLDSLPTKRERDEYMKRMEKELMKQYKPRLKKLTFSQGKLLIKLIDRQCDMTSYQLIKQYMGGFKAGFYNAFASLFGASLKKEYDPEVDDRLTERCILLIESGQM